MGSFLTKDENGRDIGLYDPRKTYAWTNWSDEAFDIQWGGEIVATVQPKQTIELPQYLAFHATKHFVDREMLRPDSGVQNMLGIPASRKSFEDKTIRLLTAAETGPQYRILQNRVREEVRRDLQAEPGAAVTAVHVAPDEFASVNADTEAAINKVAKEKNLQTAPTIPEIKPHSVILPVDNHTDTPETTDTAAGKRGRPKGSKNKPK